MSCPMGPGGACRAYWGPMAGSAQLWGNWSRDERGRLCRSPVKKGREEGDQGWMGEHLAPTHLLRAECLMRVPCTEHDTTARDHPRESRHRAPASGVDPGCTCAPSSRSAHTPLGQLTPGTLKLFAEKLFWLLHETSSFFQPCLPMPGGGCLLLPLGELPLVYLGSPAQQRPFWLQTF